MNGKPEKPLGGKCYGHICHLPGSRLGPGDHKLNEGQTRILAEKVRDRFDRVIVTEKLDGSNVGVARVGGKLVPLIRAGYPAISSHYEQHRLFAGWVFQNSNLFEWIEEGHRICGEWLAQAHGTRYRLTHMPFAAFDWFEGDRRLPWDALKSTCAQRGITIPTLLHDGGPCSVANALERLGKYGWHGAQDPVEGAVWRVERKGEVDFLGKYVRPDKVDGCYLPELSQRDAIWNWRPR